jgi:nucleotide-binding universal stress UspA family protein
MHGKTILIAVDGSPAASAAVARGLELAAALESDVRFVHGDTRLAKALYADRPDGPSTAEIVAADAVLGSSLEQAAGAGIAAELSLVGESSSVELADAVAGMAAGMGAGLVVTGSRGRGSVAGAVLGSFSQTLIAQAAVPVLVVQDPAGPPQ